MELWYPGATRKPDFSKGSYAGSPMEGNCLCLHSTETTGLPGYRGGATTPHLTTLPDFENEKIDWSQHLPINRSARALENRSGGVETNTFGVIQVEMGGTCDSQYAKTWGTKKVNVDYIYTEAPPDWYIAELAKFVVWLDEQLPDFRIENSAEEWRYYRRNGSTTGGSYGPTSSRFTTSEWPKVYGIFGHGNAPEQSHGDPGAFPCDSLVAASVALRDGTTPPVVVVPAPPDPTLPPTVYDKMLPASYFRGVVGDHVTWYGQRVRIWSEALNLPDPYAVGPGPEWGPADERGTQAIQLKVWPGSSTAPGGDADGFPGFQSLPILAGDPAVEPPVIEPKPSARKIKVTSLSYNEAGYNKTQGTGKEQTEAKQDALSIKRVPELAEAMSPYEADVIHLQESSAAMRKPLAAALPEYFRVPEGSLGREIFLLKSRVTYLHGGLVHSKSNLNGDDKPWVWSHYSIDGAEFLSASGHLENQDGIDRITGRDADEIRVDQALEIVTKLLSLAEEVYEIPVSRIQIDMDGNSYDWVRQAIEKKGFVSAAKVAKTKVNEEYKTHTGWGAQTKAPKPGSHFDISMLPDSEDVEVTYWGQKLDSDPSDHNLQRTIRIVTI